MHCRARQSARQLYYTIVPSLVDPNNQRNNYQVALDNGALTVTPAAPPTIVSVTPDTGPTNGGATVTILGTGFESGATVNFGALPAASLNLITPTHFTAVTPPASPGTVDVVLTNADGQSVIFTNAFTYVAPLGTAPSIVSQLTNQAVASGTSVMFSVSATGTAPLNYQWQLNGTNLADDSRITGSQRDLLAIANVLLGDAGRYQVVVTNAYGSVTSAATTLAVVALPVFLTVTQTGGTIAFTWSATAGQTYQAQYKTNLNQPNWTDFVIVTATNSTAAAADAPNPDTQRFYRIISLPR